MGTFVRLTLLAVLLLCCYSLSAQQKSLAIATVEYPPYSSKSLPEYGYVNHIVSTAFENAGYDVNFVFLPWSRALHGAKAGDFDLVSYANYNESRTEDFIHSTSFGEETIVFLANKNVEPKNWKNLNELAGYRFGATRNYTYSKEYWDFVETLETPPSIVNTDMQNMLMLVMKRIDLFPVDQVVADHLVRDVLREIPTADIEILTTPLAKAKFHILVPKINKDAEIILKIFNRSISEMRRSGKLQLFERKFKAGHYSSVEIH